MSTLDGSSATPATATQAEVNYLNCDRSFASWALTLDHKRIGVMYLAGIIVAFVAAGSFALLVRTTLLVAQKNVAGGSAFPISADLYNTFFTLHGALMVFVVIIPGVPAALGNFVLPLMLGAKDVAFPRLNLASFYLWCGGVLILLSAIVFGNIDTGWTFYAPYSTEDKYSMGGVPFALLGAFTLGFSSIFTGLNFITTIHKLRPPEMGWFKMPLMLWALYSTAVIQVLATPVLAITLLMLFVERVVGIGIFNPSLGGDPVLMQHFFWFYSHPAVYIMVLPAMGVTSELLSVFSRKHIFGYVFIAYSSIAIAIISFIVWGHHMFTSGQSDLVGTIFSALTFTVAVPSAIKVFNWIATLYGGSISLKAPMIYALSFIWIFGIGGLTGLFLSTMSLDVHFHDTYFVVAHFHFTMAATIFVFLGGVHYWWPKITGKMYNERLGQVGALVSVIGFNITFLAQFVMGARGMPRRYYNYDDVFQIWHHISTGGAWMAGIGFLISVYCLVHSLFRGRKAPDNPWGAATIEWRTSSPPSPHNFDTVQEVTDPYDFSVLKYRAETDDYEYVGPQAT
jgi:cytochrome c oxidase subunit 1